MVCPEKKGCRGGREGGGREWETGGVCVRERERELEREGEGEGERDREKEGERERGGWRE